MASKNVATAAGWIAVPVEERITVRPLAHEPRTAIHLLDSANLAVRARITIDGTTRTSVRIQGDRLVVFDTCGRVIVVSLSSGAVLREHRLT